MSVAINVTKINNHLDDDKWKGVQFSNQVGIWFHPTVHTAFTYLDDGTNGIASYGGHSGWYDTNAPLDTTSVPEPGMLALLGIGAVGFLRRRKLVTV